MRSSRTFGLALLLAALLVPACGGGGGGGGGGDDEEPKRLRIVESQPSDGQAFVSQDQVVSVELSDPVDPDTLPGAVILQGPDGPVDATVIRTVEDGGHTLLVDPEDRLEIGTDYTLLLLKSLANADGLTLRKDRTITFRTVPQPTPRPPVAADFHPTGPMAIGRSQHTATLLEDGNVILVGGFRTSAAITDTAEIYDPVNKLFAPAGDTLAIGRARHTATRLEDGRVLLVGGLASGGNEVLSFCEIYDPELNAFQSTGSLSQARAYHTASLLEDGRVLVCGGQFFDSGGAFVSTDRAEIYDPATEIWSAASDRMVRKRSFHTATTLEDGRILLAGGASDWAAEIFDPSTGEFERTAQDMREFRGGGHTAFRLENGNVLLSGGGAMRGEVYVVDTDRFVRTDNSLTWNRYFATATPVPDGGVLVLGGIFFGADETLILASMDLFGAAQSPNGSYFQVPHVLFEARAGHTATVLEDGRSVLFVGGINTDSTEPELETGFVYDPIK